MQLVIIVLLIVGFIALYRKFMQRRVTVKYEPIVYYAKKLFRKKVVAGYRIQLHYDGIPVGESSEKIVYVAKEVDEEAIEKALTGALSFVKESIKAVPGVSLMELGKGISEVIKELRKP